MIRCERCSTLYELDEALLSPEGSPVQCTRCQHVFTAFPTQAPGRTLVGVPPADEPAGGRAVAAAPEAARAPEPRAEPPAPAEERPEAPRARWGTSAPVYRPPAPAAGPAAAPPGVGRSRLLKRDAVGAFEARLRWSARWRWLAPVLAAAVLLAAGAAWFLVRGRGAGDEVARRQAMALAAHDDRESLERAAARLDEALRRAPGAPGAAADRAAVDVLRAAAALEESEALAARLAASGAERERLRREAPAGWVEAEREAAREAQALEADLRSREDRARALADGAVEVLRGVRREGGAGAGAARALALHHALRGEREAVAAAVRAARAGAPADPWLLLAEAWAEARQPDGASREAALAALGRLSAAHPELLRGRYLLARTQAALGREREALATLDGLLAANARHEGGQRLRAELAAAAEPPPAPAPEPAPPALAATPPPVPARRPAGDAAAQPRKTVSHPVPPAPSPGAEPALAPAAVDAAAAAVPGAAEVPAQGEALPFAPAPIPPAGGGAGDTAPAKDPPPRPAREEDDLSSISGG